jgi:surface polysaccharide O-acyltransferase-like enzyme
MTAPRIPLFLFATSLVVYTVSVGTELVTAFALDFLYGEETKMKYSGEFDWLDVGAYTIGMLAMTLNYVLIGRKVSRRITQQQTK